MRLTPLIVPLSVAASLSNSRFMGPYWQEITAKATIGMIAFCPAYAAAAAWDAGRFRSVRAQMSRSPLALAALVVAPAVVGCLLALSIALSFLWAASPPVVGLPDGRLFGLVGLLTAALALFGYAVGTYVPRLYAAPAAFASVWLWLVFPPTFTPFWVRNVTGNLGTSCCSLDTVLPDRALLAPGVVGVSLILGSVVILVQRQWRTGLPLCAALLATGLFGGRALAADFGADPVVARGDSMDCSQLVAGEHPYTVCTWPENRAFADRAPAVLVATAERLREVGVIPPRLLTERLGHAPEPYWTFSAGDGNELVWAASLATAPVQDIPPACLEQTGGNWAAGGAYEPMLAWLQLSAGLPPEGVAAQFAADTMTAAEAVRRAPPAEQGRWYRANLRALSVCDLPPVDIDAASSQPRR